MHAKRWITALVAIPLLVLLIAGADSRLFAAVVGAVALLTLHEYVAIAFPGPEKTAFRFLLWIGYAAIWPLMWAAQQGAHAVVLALVSLNAMVAGGSALPRFKSDASIAAAVARQVLGVVYIPLPLALLVLMRGAADGVIWLFWLLAIVFAGDTAAFYTGTYKGRRKLCPSISPKKTVEGALGGLGANLLVGCLLKALFLPLLPWGASLIFILVAGLAGQCGDLFASVLKRSAGVKDSGRILPGHGGMLDRIDALLFAAPVAYCFQVLILP
jgi:phosphatidate cytidylyltransferase